ncbi:MAG: hypothetical protein WBM76_05440, partial [Woeseiaceae bacterium]
MRFKMRQVSNIAFAESIRPAPLTSVGTPAVEAPAAAERPVPDAQPVVAPVTSAVPPVVTPAVTPVEIEPAVQPVATDVVAPAVPDLSSTLASFFDALSAFLQSVGEGFQAEMGSGSFTYHYSESFKLNLLKAVVNTVAPEESTDAAANAESVLDEISA